MRMLMRFQFDAAAANRAIEDGSTAALNEKMFAELQGEAASFGIEDGVRTAYPVFDLEDPTRVSTRRW